MINIYSGEIQMMMRNFTIQQLVKDFFSNSQYHTKSKEEATEYFLQTLKMIKKAEGVPYTDEQMQNDLEIFLDYAKEMRDKK